PSDTSDIYTLSLHDALPILYDPCMLDSKCVGPDSALKRFQPVYVAKGTETSGIFKPASSLPSRSTWGTSTGNLPFTSGGSSVMIDRKSTRLNSSHQIISYAV